MEIDFILTKKDYMEFNMFHYKNSPKSQKQRKIIGGVLTFVVLIMCTILVGGLNLFAVGLSATFAFLWFNLSKNQMAKSLARGVGRMMDKGENQAFIGEKHITLYEDKIVMTDPFNTTKILYSKIQKVVSDGTRTYVYIGEASALIIPSAAFKSEEDKKDFFEIIEEKGEF